ncbi:MAG: N-acetylneuraminate synthase [Deltaproteobacteria bacterium]|nr:N-acetylneuraminate synthase [Deltaproteobacteria bacterium]
MKRCFIIAEAGVNHNGDLKRAVQLVDLAKESGADAVKFQTFKAEELVSSQAPKADYQKKNTARNESQLEMIRKLELPFKDFRRLSATCRKVGIHFMSTPFDHSSIDFLSEIEMPFFKIPSSEITNFPYLDRIARAGKPLILSTGMSTLKEVQEAVSVLTRAGNKEVILLHCTSSYPADPRDANLRAMQTLKEVLGLPVGYSDHTPGIEVSLAAVALGACVIEKHFTLDRNLPGPDHKASLSPDELHALVRGIRIVESAIGSGEKEPAESEKKIAAIARKSLVAARDILPNTVLTHEMIAIKRPGTGISPAKLQIFIGKRSRVAIAADTPLLPEMFQ